ncbi:phosphoribosylanthranilate isomerase [Akkermansiaceae bacterium]|nr:phosphoribosylanthranilate isomerase [Akkermansiaceae bacterium]MDB4538068.1 phosphoribosylanthranilate isomerase [Akkermansiaceae bacterium]
MHSEFFAPKTSLKICGVTSLEDAQALADLKIGALGINFWPPSKRYCSPEVARTFSPQIKGRILRVGVFVNNALLLAEELFKEDLIDVVQLHGDETREDIDYFLSQNIPVIRAVSATNLPNDLPRDSNFALLIDTPAGKDYGGTGKTFDWSLARDFITAHPGLPVILAGGLTPDNAADALTSVNPAALDVASGAELNPGIKDLDKVTSFLSLLS